MAQDKNQDNNPELEDLDLPEGVEAAEPPAAAQPEAEPDVPAEKAEAAPARAPVKEPPAWLFFLSAPWVAYLARVFVIVILLIPFLDFMRVAVPRMSYPYELEWLEGEVAVYAVRWQEKPSLAYLYPSYEQGNYVPHLYPPLFQIATATLQSFVGGSMMACGRFISILSTLAIMAGIMMIVRDTSRSWLAGIMGGLLYAAYFKPTGYWYDLVRVDSMAYALAIWAAWFISRTKGGWFSLTVGLVLAVLAHFTKQTSVFIPVLALGARVFFSVLQLIAEMPGLGFLHLRPASNDVYKSPRAPFYLVVPVIFIAVNLAYIIGRASFGDMTFYLYEVGGHHHIFYDKIGREGFQALWQYYTFLVPLIPLGLWTVLLLRRWGAIHHAAIAFFLGIGFTVLFYHYFGGLAERSDDILRSGIQSFATIKAMEYTASSWSWVIRASAAATAGGIAVWVVRWVLYRTTLNGLWWFGALFAAQHIAAVTWVKIGGYINNFTPLFVIQSIVFGLVACWYFRGLERIFGRIGSVIAAATIVVLFGYTWFGTRDTALQNDPSLKYAQRDVFFQGPDTLAEAPWWLTDGLRYDKGAVYTTREKGQAANFGRPDPDNEDRWILQDAQFLGRQLPSPAWKEWGPKVLDRIRELDEDGGVYLPHQNYLAHLAGLPIQPSIDSIRDVAYMGKDTPGPLMNKVRSRHWKHIVTMMHVQYEWMTPDFQRAMRENYELQGELVPGAPWEAYMPVTGVQMKPMHVYTAKPQ